MTGKSAFAGTAGLILMSAMMILAVPASMTASVYELEFSIITDGGGASASDNYSAEIIITTSGVEEGAPQSSATYSVESLLVEPEPPLKVDSWIFY